MADHAKPRTVTVFAMFSILTLFAFGIFLPIFAQAQMSSPAKPASLTSHANAWEEEEAKGDKLLEQSSKVEGGPGYTERHVSPREAAMKHFVKAATMATAEHSHLHWAISTAQMMNVMGFRFGDHDQYNTGENAAIQIKEIRKTTDLLLPVLNEHPEINDPRITNALKTAVVMYGQTTDPDYRKARAIEDLLAGRRSAAPAKQLVRRLERTLLLSEDWEKLRKPTLWRMRLEGLSRSASMNFRRHRPECLCQNR